MLSIDIVLGVGIELQPDLGDLVHAVGERHVHDGVHDHLRHVLLLLEHYSNPSYTVSGTTYARYDRRQSTRWRTPRRESSRVPYN